MEPIEQRATRWKSYEEVAIYLLDQFAKEFGLERVEGKQKISGQQHSGTAWEVDGKGCRQDDTGFVIVECKRYTTSKLSQAIVGGLAYTIRDTGGDGGIVVSPLGVQEGAKLIATAEKIVTVLLNENCNRSEHVLRFLDKIMVGMHITAPSSAHIEAMVLHKPPDAE